MERGTALDLLGSENPVDRLRAARALKHLATESDRPALEAALSAESDAWVRSALSKIVDVDLEEHSVAPPPQQTVEDPGQLARDVRAQTTQELTAMISHELAPLLGTLRQAGMDELDDYQDSDTIKAVAGVESFLGALRSLHLAAGVPAATDFSLSDLVLEVTKAVLTERSSQGASDVPVHQGRTDHVPTTGDRNLVRLGFVNLLRNALEASDPRQGGSGEAVVVNWGSTDRDGWIAVFDRGVGLPVGASRMTEPGVTTKNKGVHAGMGLAVTALALESMDGSLSYRPRDGGGVVFEMRWNAGNGSYANAAG